MLRWQYNEMEKKTEKKSFVSWKTSEEEVETEMTSEGQEGSGRAKL